MLEIELFKSAHGFTDSTFDEWHQEELQYLQSIVKEPENDVQAMEYVDALQNLEKLQYVSPVILVISINGFWQSCMGADNHGAIYVIYSG